MSVAGTDFVLLSNQKPAYGAPCNNCGFCCQNKACYLSLELLKSDKAPCIALESDHGRFVCGLVKNPGHYLPIPSYAESTVQTMMATLLGVGKGCDSQ